MMMGSSFSDRLLFRRFLLSMALLLVCSVIIGGMLAVLTIVGLYIAYRMMQEHGMAADTALLYIWGAALFFIAVISMILYHHFLQLRYSLKNQPTMLSGVVGDVLSAFMAGLFKKSSR
ncbi:MAG: hypothetical protein ACOYK8_06400 [Alphaproteobacteria bacterium]